MTTESDYLRALARRVVGVAVGRTAIRAALLAGSAGRGNADRFSDLDLLFYVDSVPASETLTEIRTAVGGVDPLRRYQPTDYANGEEFQLRGVRTEVVFLTVEHVERQLDELLDQFQDVASSRQKLLAGIAEGLALHGEELAPPEPDQPSAPGDGSDHPSSDSKPPRRRRRRRRRHGRH